VVTHCAAYLQGKVLRLSGVFLFCFDFDFDFGGMGV
jgi:hypothetical protein